MYYADNQLIFSASDLNAYLECTHLVALERAVAYGTLDQPEANPSVALIAQKGLQHEEAYLASLRSTSRNFTEITLADTSLRGIKRAANETISAMERGSDLIYQATFFHDGFLGKADFLLRVERPCAIWPWSYEVADTKLALSEKPYFIIQLSHYSEHVARIQGSPPESMHVVLGNNAIRRFRVDDFSAYYRHLKTSFLLHAMTNDAYPFKCKHCSICDWAPRCEQRRSDDDHLSLVAGMRQDQVKAFESVGITTMTALATPHPPRPLRMAHPTFERLHKQAQLQVRGREMQTYCYELLEQESQRGFTQMPEPDQGDLFFDMEGDPLYEIGIGLEYLFGIYAPDDPTGFTAFWGTDRSDEKRAFEQCIDFFIQRRKVFPTMHIYHYAPYEKTALRKLSQRHHTREDEVDELLRGEVLIDLYAVVRQSVMISQSSYSIKKLEPFYGMKRTANIRRGDDSVIMFEQWLLNPNDNHILHDIEHYNEEDCRSTHLLREWLLVLRSEYEKQHGLMLAFKPIKHPANSCHESFDASCKLCLSRERQQRESQLRSHTHKKLLESAEPCALLLGHLMSYHRNEEKPIWWALFDRCENIDQLIEFDHEAIGGLRLRTDIAPEKQSPRDRNLVYTFAFPDQAHHLSGAVWDPRIRESIGTIVHIDDEHNLLQIKLNSPQRAAAITELIPSGPIATGVQRAALARIADAFLDGSLESTSPVTLDLLRNCAPRLTPYPPRTQLQPTTADVASILPILAQLDHSYLFLQGPPGSGKTYIGARMILALIESGKRVGVMANSHKAIHNILYEIESLTLARGASSLRAVHKYSTQNKESEYRPNEHSPLIEKLDDNEQIERGDYTLIAGNSWLFARDGMVDKLDYLFLDEAGQTSLADAIAVSPCAQNIVFLGDPMQLAQVSQGSHDEGAGKSVLEHLLGAAATVSADRGILLDVSYRMHPEICSFISEMVYDGRLKWHPSASFNAILAPGVISAGLSVLPVLHSGNRRASIEEADRIAQAVERLLAGTVSIKGSPPRLIGADDIMIVTPFNAQRKLIRSVLAKHGHDRIRVGTVDKFQGQEAPVVFYSLATSSSEDLPRNMEFLFEKNRFNVAVSRAQCLSILVYSPALLDLRCDHVEQITLVNLLCRYVELASNFDVNLPLLGQTR